MNKQHVLNEPVDVAIIGGGFVGYLAALACAHLNLRVCILEAQTRDLTKLSQVEGRAIALAHSSCTLLKSLKLWENISAQAYPIHQVHISQQGSFGKCRIDAQSYHLPALGHIVPATHLAVSLAQAIDAHDDIELIAPAMVTALDDGVITFEEANETKQLTAKLVLACDGAQSFVRDHFNIETSRKNYQQHAIVANVSISEPHKNIARQRFTPKGVLAMLPLAERRMTSVLTLDETHFQTLMQLDDADYLAALQSLLGQRAGRLTNLGKRFTYPLAWVQANQTIANRTILLGNAAHTISPVAAQGLNLALRDIAVMADLLSQAISNNQDIGEQSLLNTYEQTVLQAQKPIVDFTDKLTEWVKPHWLKPLRSVGLSFLDVFTPIKTPVAHQLMGLSKHGGRLMREGCDAV